MTVFTFLARLMFFTALIDTQQKVYHTPPTTNGGAIVLFVLVIVASLPSTWFVSKGRPK